jgi:hypothetical protein
MIRNKKNFNVAGCIIVFSDVALILNNTLVFQRDIFFIYKQGAIRIV